MDHPFAKKREIGKTGMVAENLNGAAWRRQSGTEHRHNSTIEEAFANTKSAGLHLCGDQVAYEASRLTCGFIKPPWSETEWHIRIRGAFKFHLDTLGYKASGLARMKMRLFF